MAGRGLLGRGSGSGHAVGVGGGTLHLLVDGARVSLGDRGAAPGAAAVAAVAVLVVGGQLALRVPDLAEQLLEERVIVKLLPLAAPFSGDGLVAHLCKVRVGKPAAGAVRQRIGLSAVSPPCMAMAWCRVRRQAVIPALRIA